MSERIFIPPACGVTGNGVTRRGMLSGGFAGAIALGLGPRAGLAAPPPNAGGQVVISFSQEPTVFNPLMPHIEVDQGVHWNIFSPLWIPDANGEFVPELATEVPTVANGGISADGLSWKVKLRGDVKWHDGAPFTAEDVKFSFDLINDPKFRAFTRNGFSLMYDTKVEGPTEISWRTTKPYAPLPALLSWTFIVPQHILASASDPNTTPFNNAPVGTGPFMWKERVPGDHITLAANPRYFGSLPHLQTVVFKYIPDLTVMFTQFQVGAIDYIGLQGITADHYDQVKKLKDRNVVVGPSPFCESVILNLSRPHFQERVVREALYTAMDTKSVIEQVYYGLPGPTVTFLPRQSWAFNPNLMPHEYDPAKAKALLDSAGWKPGGDGIREKNGVRLSFINSTTAGNHVRETTQQLLQQNWRDVGVEMTIKNMPPAVVWGDYTIMSQFDSLMASDDMMYGGDPDVTSYFASNEIPAKGGAGLNFSEYVNQDADNLLLAGATTFEHAKRQQIYWKLGEILRQDLPRLPMFQDVTIEGTKQGLIGYQPNVYVACNTWNVKDWYWAKS